jgi:hypothetical protein
MKNVTTPFLSLLILIMPFSLNAESHKERMINYIRSDGTAYDEQFPEHLFRNDVQKNSANYAGTYISVDQSGNPDIGESYKEQTLVITINDGQVNALYSFRYPTNDIRFEKVPGEDLMNVSIRGNRFEGKTKSGTLIQGRFVILKVYQENQKGLLNDKEGYFWIKK